MINCTGDLSVQVESKTIVPDSVTSDCHVDELILLQQAPNLSFIHLLLGSYASTVYVHEKTKARVLNVWLQIYLSFCSSSYIYLLQTAITWRWSAARWLCIKTRGLSYPSERFETGGQVCLLGAGGVNGGSYRRWCSCWMAYSFLILGRWYWSWRWYSRRPERGHTPRNRSVHWTSLIQGAIMSIWWKCLINIYIKESSRVFTPMIPRWFIPQWGLARAWA